jgi:hypothetical protein
MRSFFPPFFSFTAAWLKGGWSWHMELAHGAGIWCGQEGGGTHAMGMRVQGPRAVSSFFSFLLYLFVMNDREIPRNKFDSTLDAF